MGSKKRVVVTGATGHQGGAVVNALLVDGRFAIRAVSREPESEPARALVSKGVEVVRGEPGDKESMMRACRGAYAVFGVTVPGFVGGRVDEKTQGQNLVDACKENKVDIFVWSSLPSCKDTSGGRYSSSPFDDKAEVEKYIKAAGQPAIVFRTGAFVDNFINMRTLKRDAQEPNKYHAIFQFGSPKSVQPYTYVSKDLGPIVVAAISKREDPVWRAELSKAPIPLVSFTATHEHVVRTLRSVTGKDIDYVKVPLEKLPPFLQPLDPWCDEECWGYGDEIPVDIVVRLGTKIHTLEDYARDELIPWLNSQD